jgi:hypothetical protein
MLRAAASRCARGAIRRLSSAASPAAVAAGARRQPPLDEGDWSYHREWWGEDEGPGEGAHTVFRRHSEHGNGVVSVSAYPASRPVNLASVFRLDLLPCWGRRKERIEKLMKRGQELVSETVQPPFLKCLQLRPQISL